MISQDTIEEIKNRARLSDIAAESISLTQRGGNYIGLCPFHNEKTPSFHIREDNNYYHCFGCGASGNVITFVMELQGLSFPDAVDYLAGRYNIEIKREGFSQDRDLAKDRSKLYRLNSLAQQFFSECLKNGDSRIIDYLNQRQISREAIEAFGIGFSPQAWDTLIAFLKKNKIADQQIVDAGLARRNSKGDIYDTFRGRLVFPVFIDKKSIAGFGGRLVPAFFDQQALESAPKYLNSQESAVYQKNRILFGIPQARQAIRSEKELFLVEGYMDVVSLWQAGVKNVAATCGTAVTENHIKKLAAQASRVFVLFDGDQAGRNAAAKSFTVFINSGIDVSAVFLPQGQDPDSIAQKHGEKTGDYLKTLKTEAVSLLECYIESLAERFGGLTIKNLGAAAKAKVADETAKTLSRIANDIERSELIKNAAFKLMVDRSQLEAMSDNIQGKSEPLLVSHELEADDEDEQQYLQQKVKAVSELPAVDRSLLHAVMVEKEQLCNQILKDPNVALELETASRLFIEGLQAIFSHETDDEQKKKHLIKRLLQSFGPSWVAHWKKSYQMREDNTVDMRALYRQCCVKLEKRRLQRSLDQLDLEITACSDAEAKEHLLQEKLILSRRLQSVK